MDSAEDYSVQGSYRRGLFEVIGWTAGPVGRIFPGSVESQ